MGKKHQCDNVLRQLQNPFFICTAQSGLVYQVNGNMRGGNWELGNCEMIKRNVSDLF